jgi:hypothetical protein
MIAEVGLSMLKYKGETPMLASCNRCALKFFTPPGMMTDAQAATDYLWKKFNDHHCSVSGAQRRKSDSNSLTFQSRNANRTRIA